MEAGKVVLQHLQQTQEQKPMPGQRPQHTRETTMQPEAAARTPGPGHNRSNQRGCRVLSLNQHTQVINESGNKRRSENTHQAGT
jgi:hypothetical protein